MQMYGMTGEKLGTIGQQPEGLPWKLPSWKQDFLSKPSASVRRGIAWGFNSPYEDTNTLVLTAPSGEFVDVRFPKDIKPSQSITDNPSFWAFSGKAETTFHDPGAQAHAIDMPYSAHCRFLHDIDSRGPDIADEGDMFMLTNGDCMECGIMLNPATGKNELYKEYWCGAHVLPVPGGEYDANSCVVAKVVSPGRVRGIVIKLGGRVQGILERQREDDTPVIEIERWIRGSHSFARPLDSAEKGEVQGPWSRDIRSNARLPGGWLCMGPHKIGDELEFNGVSWRICEVHL